MYVCIHNIIIYIYIYIHTISFQIYIYINNRHLHHQWIQHPPNQHPTQPNINTKTNNYPILYKKYTYYIILQYIINHQLFKKKKKTPTTLTNPPPSQPKSPVDTHQVSSARRFPHAPPPSDRNSASATPGAASNVSAPVQPEQLPKSPTKKR